MRQKQKLISFISGVNPLVFGIILITIIVSYFLVKTVNSEYKLSKLEERLQKEKQENQKIDIEMVSPEQVYQWIGKSSINLVDIRTEEEFQLKHIESSVNIPLQKIEDNLNEFSKEKKNVVIDRKNTTEGKILVEHFKEEGLDIVYLDGGILKYAQENYPLITTGNLNNPVDFLKTKTISAENVKKGLLNGQIFSFVDTRSEFLFLTNKIDGSINIPLEKIESNKKNLPAHTMLLFDSDPTRAWQAGVKLYDMGISNFYVCINSYEDLKKTLFNNQSTN